MTFVSCYMTFIKAVNGPYLGQNHDVVTQVCSLSQSLGPTQTVELGSKSTRLRNGQSTCLKLVTAIGSKLVLLLLCNACGC